MLQVTVGTTTLESNNASYRHRESWILLPDRESEAGAAKADDGQLLGTSSTQAIDWHPRKGSDSQRLTASVPHRLQPFHHQQLQNLKPP